MKVTVITAMISTHYIGSWVFQNDPTVQQFCDQSDYTLNDFVGFGSGDLIRSGSKIKDGTVFYKACEEVL